MSEQEQSLIQYHRDNLANNTFLEDEKGLTTVYITGVTGPDGKIYNVPGFFDGKRQSPEAARERAAKIGWENFPSYNTGEEANKAAKELHKIIDKDIENRNINEEEPTVDTRQLVMDEGGDRASVYNDTTGNPTAGIGHNLSDEEEKLYPVGTTVPPEVRKKWFEEDVKTAKEDVKKFKLTNMPPEVNEILTNMVFNMGHAKFNPKAWPKLFKALKNRDWPTAAEEMINSKWYHQTGRRAKRLVEKMRKING